MRESEYDAKAKRFAGVRLTSPDLAALAGLLKPGWPLHTTGDVTAM